MPNRRARLLFPIAMIGALTITTGASGPTFWTVATAGEFVRGQSEGVYVNLDGSVSAGPALTSRLSSTAPQVWGLATTTDGSLWAGTGGDGRLVRLRAGQPDVTAFDPDESNIFAVAASGNTVYAATSPDGRVYRLQNGGEAQPFFDPEEKYIWALAVDASGQLWVGTGTPAALYRVDGTGNGQLVYKPPADHVVALAIDAGGHLLAGTESPGRLYRFDGDRPFVLLDSGMTELRAITAMPDGTVYAAAVARGDASTSEDQTTSVSITVAEPPTGGAAAQPPSAPAKRSSLFRIEASGVWESVWDTPDLVYDVAPGPDGSVLAATGPAGRLYRISAGRDVQLYSGVDAKQITRFARGAAGTVPAAFATANPGRVIAIGPGTQSPATYLSPVHDTTSVATWGRLTWESQGGVRLFTRSGNTATPDDSWSDWSAAYTSAAGASVTSPAARYLQWKAELTAGATPARLSAVTVAYLPRNNRPVVTAITVHPPGVVFQRPFANEEGAIAGLDDAVANARRPPGDTPPTPPSPGRRMYAKGLQTFQWKAEDADDDRLTYTLQYRRDGEADWHDLRADLLDTIYVWDTTTTIDGRYFVRVQASDADANAGDRALVGERISEPVTVDNTPPVITVTSDATGGAVRLQVRVQDAVSPIQKLEYSVDGGPWRLVYPADGLADSTDERYEIPVASAAEAARVVVRATDLLQNVTSRSGAGRQPPRPGAGPPR
ncbi:MAG: hypothetical protein R2752_06695 [Vicinamibacterales bacterium]